MPENKNNVFAELGRRGVYQAVGIYVAVAWGSIEILITASERFGWPAWLGDAALILFLTGLPFMILLSWAFDLTGSGLQRMEPGSLTGKAVIAGTLTVVLGLSGSWFVLREPAPGVEPVTAEEIGQGRPVIAVLPFQDFVRDGDSEVLALAFTDELINRINAHPDLAALTLASAQRAGEMAVVSSGLPDVPADFFVQGALRPAQVGTQLQVRLVDQNGLVRWEHDQVRDFSDMREALQAQAYLAGEVAASMGVSLTGEDYCAPSANTAASQLYYQAREQFALRGAENVAGAARKLERAVELDPEFARALDLLGSVYTRFPFWVSRDPAAYGMSLEELQEFFGTRPHLEALKRALDLCPSLGSAYVTVEVSAPVRHYLADLIDLVREALRRDPGNTPLMDNAIYVYLNFGHLDTARAMAEEYLRRDPLSPRAPHVAALVYRALGDSERALALEQDAISLGYTWRSQVDEMLPGRLLGTYDRYVAGRHEEMLNNFEDDSEATLEKFPYDPRLLLRLDEDPFARTEIMRQLAEFTRFDPDDFNSADPVFSTLFGRLGHPPWLFELGDRVLVDEYLDRLVDLKPGPAWTPHGFWFVRWRHWFGDDAWLAKVSTWSDEYHAFWDRHGPPDGCEWDGESLKCEWAESAKL